jgi:predicted metal-dependent peptidase
MDAQQKVSKAREALMLDQRFFGTLICATPIIEATHIRGQRIDTMATDYKAIYYNPAFVDTLTVGEVKGVLCHEVMHIAYGHSLRRNGRDPFLWNVACDYAINPLILKGKMILPKDCLNDPQYSGMSAEEIYLREQAKPKPAPAPQQKGTQAPQQGGEGDGAGQSGDAPGEAEDEPQDGADQDQGEPDQDEDKDDSKPGQDQGQDDKPGQGEDDKPDFSKPGLVLDAIDDEGKPLTDADRREAMADMQVKIIQAAQIATKAGQDAAGFERLVEEAKNPREDWVEVLRRFIQQNVEVPSDPTWSKLNRRAFALGNMLPGRVKEGLGELLIAIDTSGSMDELLVGRSIAELKAILEDTDYETVTVMACDAWVHWHATFAKGEEPVIRVPGGGGTAFSPVWRKAEALGLTPRACVYFTDLDCYDFGEEPEYPVLWAQWGSYPAKPPFGEVVKVELA